MDITATTATAMQSVKGDIAVGLLKKELDQNKLVATQLISTILEGSLDPNLGKQLDIKI